MTVKKKLKNNFTYYVNNDEFYNGSYIITIVVKFGSAYETKHGIAHLLEHMLMSFYTYGKCPQFIKKISAHTDYFETTYTIECSNNYSDLKSNLKFIADVMRGKYMKERYFSYVKLDVLNEIKNSIKHCGYQREVFSIILGNSEYTEKRAIGEIHIVEEITYEEIKKIFDLWYSSNRMAVIVSGNFENKIMEIEKEIVKHYNSILPSDKEEIIQHFKIPQYKSNNKIYNVSLGMKERTIESIDVYIKVQNRYSSVYHWMQNCISELIVFQVMEMQMIQFFKNKDKKINKFNCELIELDKRYSFYLLSLEFPKDNIATEDLIKELNKEIQNLIEQKVNQEIIISMLKDLFDYEKNEKEYNLSLGIKGTINEFIQNFIYDKPLLSYEEKCNLYEKTLAKMDYSDIINFYSLHFSGKQAIYIIS